MPPKRKSSTSEQPAAAANANGDSNAPAAKRARNKPADVAETAAASRPKRGPSEKELRRIKASKQAAAAAAPAPTAAAPAKKRRATTAKGPAAAKRAATTTAKAAAKGTSAASASKVTKVKKPAATTVAAATPTKGKRGRPRKDASATAKATKSTSAGAAKNGTRKRGRPRKEDAGKPAKGKEEPSDDIPEIEEEEDDDDGRSYWLMKAEPESRLEKGVDVKFSIDDLAAAKEPEPWDGVRNAVARNNMRAMRKGDLAFFYHSNCKVPGIVGIMEIVREHSIDESAFDPAHPYYDPKSSRDNPKWELVHVEFRRKFEKMVPLDELKAHANPGGPLEKLQVVKQSRLSVTAVSRKQWKFILKLAGEEPEAKEKTEKPGDEKEKPDVAQPTEAAEASEAAVDGKEKQTETAADQTEPTADGQEKPAEPAAAADETEKKDEA